MRPISMKRMQKIWEGTKKGRNKDIEEIEKSKILKRKVSCNKSKKEVPIKRTSSIFITENRIMNLFIETG